MTLPLTLAPSATLAPAPTTLRRIVRLSPERAYANRYYASATYRRARRRETWQALALACAVGAFATAVMVALQAIVGG